MSEFAQRQPILAGLRNEKRWRQNNAFDRFVDRVRESVRKTTRGLTFDNARLLRAVMRRETALAALAEDVLQNRLLALRYRLRREGLRRALIIEAFAMIREVGARRLGMRHHSTQVRLGLALLRGSIAEMATGEGKTFGATLAAATAALAGMPVHVVTVNDYLAERDADDMAPLYQGLGLSVGAITHERQPDERRAAYASDICYCCNKELTFDFLRDRLELDKRDSPRKLQAALLTEDEELSRRLLLRGQHFAIVDEADSVLVDEARTPLIISGAEQFGERERKLLDNAMRIAAVFEEDQDFRAAENGEFRLTRAGLARLNEACDELDGLWRSPFYREPLVRQALAAIHRFQLDRDYIIDEDGGIQIVDPYTGRVMPGRSWGQGLQQMIEIKEGCELSCPRDTAAEISYQNFFRKYHHLCGMTGTAREVAGELFAVYGLRYETVPLLRRSRRRKGRRMVCNNEATKWRRVAELTRQSCELGQAVLIGTNSVASSEAVSEVLDIAGLTHRVLNARQDSEEAQIVAAAGSAGAVTVATSMAGRGTDIKLVDACRAAGGLHVIITELHDASRIDRQLAGRSARQGDPGIVSQVLSLEDRLVDRVGGSWIGKLVDAVAATGLALPGPLGLRLLRRCQRRIESSHYRQRMQLIKMDTQRQKALAFAGARQ